MAKFEYKVIPAPRRPKRAKGVKGNPARFANVLTETLNTEAALGWEFVRTETLPMDERAGILGGSVENFQTMMVFRRALLDDDGVGPVIAAEKPVAETYPDEEEAAAEDVPEPEAPEPARSPLFNRRERTTEEREEPPLTSEPDGDVASRL